MPKKPPPKDPLPPEVEQFRAQVGAQLRRARERKGLSLRAAGDRLGLAHGTIGNWETGVAPVLSDWLPALARLYETTVIALLADKLTNADLIALTQRQLEEVQGGNASDPADPLGKPRRRAA